MKMCSTIFYEKSPNSWLCIEALKSYCCAVCTRSQNKDDLNICCADIAHGDLCTKFWCAVRDHPEPPEISSHLSPPSITESVYKPSLVAETSVHH